MKSLSEETPVANKTGKNKQQWVNQILEKRSFYESKFVVHTDTEVVFVSENLKQAHEWLRANMDKFEEKLLLFLVPRHFDQVRLRMLKIKNLSTGEWLPTYPVSFFLEDGQTFEIEMLVDSGADVSFIPKAIGEQLGFEKSHGESVLMASGVGSTVPYLIRENLVRINHEQINIHLLWGQDETTTDVLLGRLDVFDHFDVTFSQRRREIIFSTFEPVV